MKSDKHKKRHSDEHEKTSKRARPDSDSERADAVEATSVSLTVHSPPPLLSLFRSDVEDVVDDIFGKDVEVSGTFFTVHSSLSLLKDADDQDEVAAELADLNQEEEEATGQEDAEQTGTFDDEEDQGPSRRTEEYSKKK